MQRIVVALTWLALLATPSLAAAKRSADGVPAFDVGPSCLAARYYAGSNRDLAYQACLKDEHDARVELTRKWKQFKAQDRKDCVAQGAAPVPSYVEILTCLEMSAEANALFNPDGSARNKPVRPAAGLSSPSLPAPPSAGSPEPSSASSPEPPSASSPEPAAPSQSEEAPKPD